MGEAAIAAARAVGYVGAGTVEFIAEGNGFYFMEMNTRLQVEHPVTEMITGQDLVEWQLRVAAGEPLPHAQAALHINGHAIEARVYAEDPAREFLPSIGTLSHLHQPASSGHVRVDTGVRPGDAISPHYDPMIAKLIVWGGDRATALQHLRVALAEYQVVGVQTNLALLRAIAGHEAFANGAFDTGFIGRHADVLMPPVAAASPAVLAAAALAMLEQPAPTVPSEDRWSPWNAGDAWRMNGDGYQDLMLRDGETVLTIRAQPGPAGVRLGLPGGDVVAQAEPGGLRLDGVVHRLLVVRQGEAIVVIHGGANHVLVPVDPLAPPAAAAAGGGKVMAPIPGRVARILVAPGDAVLRGAALVVIEAMKMELTLSAPMDGVIASIRPVVDEMVQEGTELVIFVVEA